MCTSSVPMCTSCVPQVYFCNNYSPFLLPVACGGGSKVHGTGLRERRYLFNGPKNDIYYINENIVKHEPFSVY